MYNKTYINKTERKGGRRGRERRRGRGEGDGLGRKKERNWDPDLLKGLNCGY